MYVYYAVFKRTIIFIAHSNLNVSFSGKILAISQLHAKLIFREHAITENFKGYDQILINLSLMSCPRTTNIGLGGCSFMVAHKVDFKYINSYEYTFFFMLCK